MFPEIKQTEVDEAKLAAASERDFVGLGVDFIIESASYLTIACNLYTDKNGWTLNQALVGGNGVRLYKLSDAYLDQICKHRLETSEIFSRLMFETAINIVFLIRNESDSLSRSYIDFSLKQERKLKKQIENRISDRKGEVLPIEQRMLASIKRLADSSGIDLDSPPINKRNWGDMNLFEKAESINWGDAYLGIFGGMSGAIHGNWCDIASHHLELFDDSGFYEPSFEWSTPRPQGPYALAQVLLTVAGEMFQYFGGDEIIGHFDPLLQDVHDKIEKATALHEGYLARENQN